MRASWRDVSSGVPKAARVAAVLAPVAALLLGAAAARGDARVAFAAGASRLTIHAPAYTLALSRRNGRILELDDVGARRRLTGAASRCLWGVFANGDASYLGGCSYAPAQRRRFDYRWNASAATLTLRYRGAGFGTAVVTIQARPTYLDLQLSIANRGDVLQRVRFPDGIDGDTRTVSAGYAPNVLPGVRLAPAYFSRVGADVQSYPSRWAFADYLAYDVGAAHLALYAVAPTGPLRPAQVGFAHLAAPAPCSGASFCLVHELETWIPRNTAWRSPVVRVRVGQPVAQTILAYRRDNGIDAYPSLAAKLGPRLSFYARAPLLKANVPRLAPFRDWGSRLGELPSPVLLHPAGFQRGGFDANDPDFLPPDPVVAGSTADFAAMIAAAHAHGDLVMPYGDVSWWDPGAPSLQGLQQTDVATLDANRQPQSVTYGSRTGIIVSPYAPAVRSRIATYMNEWTNVVPSDCLFLDQLGARPWLRDFNPASPSPLAYDDGWLEIVHEYASRCLMVEDGWDRLARDAVGFHGGLLMMSRELGLPDTYFGAGNWQPYPLATWLYHDKVLMYEHDLYDGTMAADDEVLTWNMVFGLVSSYSWDSVPPGDDPRLDLVALVQRDLGPHYVGVALTAYRDLAPGVVESTYGDLTVVGNLAGSAAYAAEGDGIAPHGFRARLADGSVVAGVFTGTFGGAPLTPGTHDVVVERTQAAVTVRQPIGADTDLAVTPPAAPGPQQVLALASDGSTIAAVPASTSGGRVVFHYAGVVAGRRVAAYRIS
jgi:uncharacterized protein DUF6259